MNILYALTGNDNAPLPDHLRIVTNGFPDGQPCGELSGPFTLDGIVPTVDRPVGCPGCGRSRYDIEWSPVYRPFRLTAPDGTRLLSVEARLVHTRYFDLVYLINEASEPVEFRLTIDRPYARIRELRSLVYWDRPEGTLPLRQTLIFKLMTDPVAIGRQAEEPRYPYHGF